MSVAVQIDLPMDAIRAYCEKWGIQEFALFGSVLREDFHEDSDIDVMVSFAETARPSLFTLGEMIEELQSILGREVDIVTRQSVEMSENYIRRKDVLNTSKVVYAT